MSVFSFATISFSFLSLSLSSNITLCAVLGPIPGNFFNRLMSLFIMASAKLDTETFDLQTIATQTFSILRLY